MVANTESFVSGDKLGAINVFPAGDGDGLQALPAGLHEPQRVRYVLPHHPAPVDCNEEDAELN